MPEPAAVRSMFARIAGRYDLLNRVLSLGIDRRWRRRALRAAGELHGRIAVDACCGTADLGVDLRRAGARVVGVDFTLPMLRLGAPKLATAGGGLLVHGDALRLPVRSGAADVAAVAFGLRNLEDPRAGIRELARVVRPGGRVLVLEFSTPPAGLFGALYRLYFTRVLPLVGGMLSGDAEAYRYLPRTVLAWPAPHELEQWLAGAGLERCGHVLLTGGIACLHWGDVPAREARA